MAATACAYGYERGCRTAIMAPFDGDGGHHHRCSVVHGDGVVVQLQPPPAPPPPPPPPLPPPVRHHRHPGLCTEGLGSESSESSGDLDIAGIMADHDDIEQDEDDEDAGHCIRRQLLFDVQQDTPPMPARARAFPPPISVIGAAGKPWQYLRAHRGGGRLVLREVRIPSRELLHARRQDGRLKLHFAFAHPDEEHHLVDDDQELNN